MTNDNAL